MRKVCSHCAEDQYLSEEDARTLRLSVPKGKRVKVKAGHGCAECRSTGYLGRTGLFEILTVDDLMKQLILEGADTPKLKREAVRAGMRTLRQAALRKLAQGQTTFEEVVRVTAF